MEEVIEKTEIKMDEELFDEAFEEAGKEGAPTGSEITPKEGAPAGLEITPKEQSKEEPKPPPDEKEEKIQSLEKQLHDTKGWGTKSAQKVAELERQIEELKKVPPKTIEEEIPEDIKSFYEDYPEFRKAVEFENKRIMKGMVPQQNESLEINKVVGQINFDQTVMFGFQDEKEGWIEGHADAPKIVHSSEFKDWIGKEKIDSNGISDPKEAIETLSRFKEAKLKGALSEHDKSKHKEIVERQKVAGASVGSTKGGIGSKQKIDKDDYDGGWDEAVNRN